MPRAEMSEADLVARLREALDSMVNQFAYDGPDGHWNTGGLSALEEAFDVLGWDDPHPIPSELICDEPQCPRRSTCGTPTANGYRRVCGEHYQEIARAALHTDDSRSPVGEKE